MNAGLRQQAHPLRLIDLALDQQLLDFHLIEGGSGTNLRLGIKGVDRSHHGEGSSVGQPQILSFKVFSFLVRENSVAQVGRSGDGQVLGKIQSVSIGNQS